MGEVVETEKREQYVRDLEDLAQRAWSDKLEIRYDFDNRQYAGRISRWLRKEARARELPLTVRQIGKQVFIWRELPPDEHDKAMHKAMNSLSYDPGERTRHLHSVPPARPETARRRLKDYGLDSTRTD